MDSPIEKLRMRNGLEKEDTSIDQKLINSTASEKFKSLCGWELGYSSWSKTILNWLDISGYDISEKEREYNPYNIDNNEYLEEHNFGFYRYARHILEICKLYNSNIKAKYKDVEFEVNYTMSLMEIEEEYLCNKSKVL